MPEELEVLPESIDSDALQSLKASQMPKPKEIDIAFFSHKLRKSTRLVGNKLEQNFLKARRDWMEFSFVELIYITDITVYASGYENYHEIELSYIDFLSSNTSVKYAKYKDGAFRFALNAFVGGFGLRPTESWFKNSKLTSIDVRGVEQRSFGDVISVMADLNSEVNAVETHLDQYLSRAVAADVKYVALTTKLEKIASEISEKEDSLAGINEEITSENIKLDEAKKLLAINESVKRNVDSQVQDARQNLESLSSRSVNLANDIQEKEARLRSLQNDINLFPTEISGYVTQGAKNVKSYAWLCAIPLLVIVFVTWRLFSNSEKILDYSVFGDKPVLEFLLSRVPYVVISFAVLAVCYTLLNRLISEIIGINRRRQDLFKISIIATDVSYASQHGLEISDETAYNLRTETKMELLKEHLRQHIGDEFIYNPKGSLFHKLSSLVSKQVADEESAGDQQST
ncbi:hypothetical protein [Rhizobium sp. LCM 4573]|uniref:hypothetical protein n=1 Tax=Rhizobium sp. LCM 4573 TaxID=1848291 RepID=UPI0008D9F2CC|nr:hypothetical protein [Rhizobium sp. LCM 4573]OHV76671.1 hypothetical protein LCM4573_13815 [Rhizobium sp. LCM 4573]